MESAANGGDGTNEATAGAISAVCPSTRPETPVTTISSDSSLSGERGSSNVTVTEAPGGTWIAEGTGETEKTAGGVLSTVVKCVVTVCARCRPKTSVTAGVATRANRFESGSVPCKVTTSRSRERLAASGIGVVPSVTKTPAGDATGSLKRTWTA